MTDMYVHNIPEPGSNVDVDVSQRAEPRPKPHATTDPMTAKVHGVSHYLTGIRCPRCILRVCLWSRIFALKSLDATNVRNTTQELSAEQKP